ncbi:phage head closure protein [Celeribacter sp.]|uniref:phage head closure protein n=1 Tax=Celeribacter sp. TaxID=1890673 RepID=UPI003A959AB3
MATGSFDKRILFLRSIEVDDGYQVTEKFEAHGSPIWAQKTDASDSEKRQAAQLEASVTSRFVVRWSTFTRGITPMDRLTCDGVEYRITGVKEAEGRRRWLEITADARIDQ